MRCGGGHGLYETQSPLAVRTQVLDPGQKGPETPLRCAGVEKNTANNEREK